MCQCPTGELQALTTDVEDVFNILLGGHESEAFDAKGPEKDWEVVFRKLIPENPAQQWKFELSRSRNLD
ncbi:hypothetical protein Clacol_000181 [Clathrus columnatus]|uniref:Uncharacterized protein n=1 Tax=Clathrus columnatus TaxID=1419009 RepID=A0AAV5A012_9AGAM|nr:hypothetical protein Clacol_000181 [Clathrus columnatus]